MTADHAKELIALNKKLETANRENKRLSNALLIVRQNTFDIGDTTEKDNPSRYL